MHKLHDIRQEMNWNDRQNLIFIWSFSNWLISNMQFNVVKGVINKSCCPIVIKYLL